MRGGRGCDDGVRAARDVGALSDASPFLSLAPGPTSRSRAGPSPRSKTRSMPRWPPSPPPGRSVRNGVPSPDPGPDAAALTAAERLAEIPGVNLRLAVAIVAETGLDMTRFPTADCLVSWTGLALVARQSRPRNRKPKKGQGDSYLKGYCTQAANGAARTDTFLGERLRRLSRRLSGNRAKCAVARSILVIIWNLLANPEARFTDLGSDWHDRKTDRDRKIRAHLRQLQALGPEVTVTPPPNPTPDQARPPAPRAVKPGPRLVTDSHGQQRVGGAAVSF